MTHHSENHFTASDVVRDVILGMSDGLTVPFALAAGLSSAGTGVHTILVAGSAEIIAGAISMGLGGFLAATSEREHYATELQREHTEIATMKEKEEAETVEIFKRYGLGQTHLMPVLEYFEQHPDAWAEFMMRYELGLEKPDESRARTSALTIGSAYVLGGSIPLLPYFFVSSAGAGLEASVFVTLAALLAFGFIKSKILGTPAVKGMLRIALIGSVAAGAAFMFAKLFG